MTMITPSYLGETIEYSSLHACRSTLEDPTLPDTGLGDQEVRRPGQERPLAFAAATAGFPSRVILPRSAGPQPGEFAPVGVTGA